MEMHEDSRQEMIKETVEVFFEAEVKPFVPDAWIDHTKTKIGYEIPFTRQFYTYIAPRAVSVIRNEINLLESEIRTLMERTL